MELFHNFHSSVEFDHRFSESFISLIPNVKEPTLLANFRPIALLGWVHKLVACVLTTRLRSVIDGLVSHTQTAFIWGCNIYDGWVVASEVLDMMIKKQRRYYF